MLLDEPFSALDTGLRQDIRLSMSAILQAEGITTLLVTHDREEAMSFADQVIVMRDGKLAQSGPPRDLYLRPRDRNTAEFLGDAIVLDAIIRDGFANCALGRIKVDVPCVGNHVIMIRPEQLSISAASSENPNKYHALVERSVFSAGTHSLTLLFASGRPITVLSKVWNPPEVGSRVAVAVTGTAHVFSHVPGVNPFRPA